MPAVAVLAVEGRRRPLPRGPVARLPEGLRTGAHEGVASEALELASVARVDEFIVFRHARYYTI